MIQRLTDIKTGSSAAFEKDSKQLLVRVDTNCLSLALADKVTGEWSDAEILSLEDADWHREDVVEDIKQKSRLAGFAGLETEIFFSTPESLPVPVALMESVELFKQTQFGKNEEPPTIDEIDAKLVVGFHVLPVQKTALLKLFPQAKWYSTLGLLIGQAMEAASRTLSAFCALHIAGQQAEMVLMQKGDLLLARCFTFLAEEDVLYHLLNTSQQLQIDSAELIVQIQGRLTEKDRLFQLLQQYLTNVSFSKVKDENTAISHAAFSQVPQHYLTPLMGKL